MDDKIIKFIGSSEYDEKLEEIGRFFNINWGDEKMSKVILLMDSIVKYNLVSENQVKEAIKKWLNFLNEEQVSYLYNYLQANFLPKVKELWQVEERVQEKEFEETFEEKERRYLEIMKELIKSGEVKLPSPSKEKPLIQEAVKEEQEELKTITFTPEEKHPQEEISLPESTIIIKKKEETPKSEDETLLDLSKL